MEKTDKQFGFGAYDIIVWYTNGHNIIKSYSSSDELYVPMFICTDLRTKTSGIFVPCSRITLCTWSEMAEYAAKVMEINGFRKNAKKEKIYARYFAGIPSVNGISPFE